MTLLPERHPAANGLVLLHIDERAEGQLPAYRHTYGYDGLARLSSKTTLLDAVTHTESLHYDNIDCAQENEEGAMTGIGERSTANTKRASGKRQHQGRAALPAARGE